MKYLKDIEIINWNTILMESGINNIGLTSVYTNHDMGVNISLIFRENVHSLNNFDNKSYITNVEPDINYNYTFSICEESYSLYLKIKDKLFGEFSNYVIIESKYTELKKRIIDIKNVVINEKEYTHIINSIPYRMFSIDFKGKLVDVVAYHSLYKRYLFFLSLYWGVKENIPIKLYKYNELDIVFDTTLKEDVLISGFVFDDSNYNTYDREIVYSVKKIIKNNGYVEYSKPYNIIQNKLKPSRNQLISSIIE
jgi:hypothetical protein